jgi:hypothetical protein
MEGRGAILFLCQGRLTELNNVYYEWLINNKSFTRIRRIKKKWANNPFRLYGLVSAN